MEQNINKAICIIIPLADYSLGLAICMMSVLFLKNKEILLC